ncbi:MAG: GGDEF domain-containing protein [Gammaproteobacteria bacterium]|nr:MAG: GGDEF domain-containing protein [Gammaproteobacteria bacterium]
MIHNQPEAERQANRNAVGPMPVPEQKPRFDATAKGVELLQALQTTLDIEQIIGLFSNIILDVVPHEGYRFRHDELDLDISEGRHSRHEAGYNLSLEDEHLGQLTLYRNWKFRDDELANLELLLGQLVYPLRNAIRYLQAIESSYNDPLTGLRNRTAMEMEMPRMLELARRHNLPVCLLMLDLDHFKHINDTHGHLCGDEILKKVGQIVQHTIRASDLAFRFGGEEIAVLLPNCNPEGARQLAERLRGRVQDEAYCEARDLEVTVSIGIAALQTGDSRETLFQRADEALYRAKHNGRNRVEFGTQG